ncbi:MAG: RagB/SusD family nutrient uptake outer membrane protein [Prevotellaceae bacterium]|nr:RagB/SusD family nutrient uptake outer membrane protein [Prevotellaceae bacterium]
MRNKIKYLLSGLCAASLLAACDLDVIPPSDMSAENFWKTEKDAWYGLNSCYAELSGCMLYDECCTDNAHSHNAWDGNMELVQQNGISPTQSYGSYNFETVRIVNNFLEHVESCDMDEALRTRMKAEARFFRAFSYLRLTRYFGKIAIVTDVLAYDAPNVARDPAEQVQAFILDELDDIASILPESYAGGYLYEKGRITRWGALALRARAALYFGLYEEAEKDAKEVMAKSGHSLFRLTIPLNDAQQLEADEMDDYMDYDAMGIDKEKFIQGLFSYEALWFDENANPTNPEYVVTREHQADHYSMEWQRYVYMLTQSLSPYQGYCSYEPMQDLVDAYWNADGRTLPQPVSMETRKADYAAMWADFKESANDQTAYRNQVQQTDLMRYAYMQEFRNRDSRLYASLVFPFKGWHELVGKGVQYFIFNPDNFNKNTNESWSGFAFRKMVALESFDNANSPCDYPVIRYAEVLLTYAEAHIETTGWDSSVQEALNQLRDRCGMPAVPESLTKEDAIEFVRNERRIELAGEGQRFHDVRRYGNEYCKEYMDGPTYNPAGDLLVKKVWDSRLMLMPIPQEAIDFNPLMKDDQNPGY